MKTQSFLQYLLLSFGLLASLQATDNNESSLKLYKNLENLISHNYEAWAKEVYSEPYPLYDSSTGCRCYCKSHFKKILPIREKVKKNILPCEYSNNILDEINNCEDCKIYQELIAQKKKYSNFLRVMFINLLFIGFAYFLLPIILNFLDEEVADDTYDRADL